MSLTVDSRFRLSELEHFNSKNEKTGICVHHTVGGSAESTFNWWSNDSQMVGTAYIIDRDGTLFEVFDPESWAWQFGLPWKQEDRIAFEKRFIGIELASEGGLLEDNGKYYCFDRVSERTEKKPEEVFDAGTDYRGYRYFDRYEPAQLETLIALVDHLCDRFDIPRKIQTDSIRYYGGELKDFEGIIGHAMVREDKSDPAPDLDLWRQLREGCNLVTDRDIQEDEKIEQQLENGLTRQQIDELFEHNVVELNKMNIAAGSMVKGLIMELERSGRHTYIKLMEAQQNGHSIQYEFVAGDIKLIKKIATALGFKQVSEQKLEVHHA